MCARASDVTSYHLVNVQDLLDLRYPNRSMARQFHPVNKIATGSHKDGFQSWRGAFREHAHNLNHVPLIRATAN